ncbi:hypothetical protein [Streptacidiphilus fuscans]|uniref:Uncharacterized protein n=1 Tax=Streptacidiphilus fuscans TaxID=2789292 RepID=A0A931BAY4_9ACTN|nr:hypothetical protein [Streptacidiphilus fuscans]MBF9067786.1 hypothetical protein [Streptacidiphilus fuscans]MBF9073869.1 hypothetical protein [Streptacidiphilus fuscans]
MTNSQSGSSEQQQAQPGWGSARGGYPPPNGYPPPHPGAYPPPPGWQQPTPPPGSFVNSPALAVTVTFLAVAIVAVLLAVWPVRDFFYDTNMAGTPGTYVASACAHDPTVKNDPYICTGTFTSTDGSLVVPDVQLADSDVTVGHPTPLVREWGGTMWNQPSFAHAAMDAAWGLAFLAGLGLVLARIDMCFSTVDPSKPKYKIGPNGLLIAADEDEDDAPVGEQSASGRKSNIPSKAPWRQVAYFGWGLLWLTGPLTVIAFAIGLIAEHIANN